MKSTVPKNFKNFIKFNNKKFSVSLHKSLPHQSKEFFILKKTKKKFKIKINKLPYKLRLFAYFTNCENHYVKSRA